MVDAKRKALIFLLLTFILALVVSGLVIKKVQDIAEASGQVETVEVAIAADNINSYETLTEDDIAWKEIPLTEEASEKKERNNYLYRSSNPEGQIALVDLEKGSIISPSIVRDTIPIPQNHRVVKLNVTENVILDQAVTEGDKVDIIVVYKKGDNIAAQRLFQKVNVVQVDQHVNAEEKDSTVKVSLSVEDAQQLIYYQNIAEQIRVLLINETPKEQPDSTETNTESETEAVNNTKENKEDNQTQDKKNKKKNDSKKSDS